MTARQQDETLLERMRRRQEVERNRRAIPTVAVVNSNGAPTSTASSRFWKPGAKVAPRQAEWEERTLAEIGVPELYRRYRLEDFDIQATIPAGAMRCGALDWSHGGFLLRGSYGQGKSCFAGALVRSMLHHEAPARLLEYNEYTKEWSFRRGSVRWWHASELSNWILDESFSGRRKSMYEELMTPRLIVLDDYGKERINTDVVREAMVTAIERWTSHRRLLIVTTNIATDADMIRHEPANASRLDALPEIILPPLDRRGAFKGEMQ